MASFVTTDAHGNFSLDGEPWFLHGATYFGRRPGTCGADWMGENFEHNLSFLDRDVATMRELGINTLGLFVPGATFFQGIDTVQERFDQLDHFLDRIAGAGLRAVMFALRGITQEAWCKAHGIDPGEGLWNPAVHPEAERAAIESARLLRTRFARRPEIIGWATGCSRFFGYGFTVPPVRDAWVAWLQKRFDGDFGRVEELFDLSADETTWNKVRMPTEMEPYFSRDNPRSFEFALMQQVLVTQGTTRIIQAVRPFTPHHLMITAMEGCCFSSGHLTWMIPEKVEADALWLESYHWEGLRSYHLVGEEGRKWMSEPVADKPSVEIIDAAGYVQMLTQWMKRSGKALILCHGVDIGERRRGVRSEEDQYYLLDRYNTYFLASGGNGVNYWCWSDDELSRTFTRPLGYEYHSDTEAAKKKYQQAGETMGVVRYDGSLRPITQKIRKWSAERAGRPADGTPDDVLVLFPCPVFQSLYRYRANLTGFEIFTSLARQGLLAQAAMSSAGERIISLEDIAPYKLVILGTSSYRRDHVQVPQVLLDYVRGGGTLFLPLSECDSIQDPYIHARASQALAALAGCEGTCRVEAQSTLTHIKGQHPAFSDDLPSAWELDMDEPAYFTQVHPKRSAQVLATADGFPLLFRHSLGKGEVYVFTWSLDVLTYKADTVDYGTGEWDWIWKGIASELGLARQLDNPIRAVILEMMPRD
jgi:hypothetical protein